MNSPPEKKVALLGTRVSSLFRFCFCEAKVAIDVHRKSLSHKIDSSPGRDSDVL